MILAISTFLCAAALGSGILVPSSPDAIEPSATRNGGVRMMILPESATTARRWRPAIVARFAHDTLGTPWTRWIDAVRPRICEPYRANSYEPPEDVFWVYRCQEPTEVGRLEAESFLLSTDSAPTLERTRWSAGPIGSRFDRLGDITDTLAAELAAGLGQELRLQRRDVLGGRYGSWTLIAEFTTDWGRLRLFQGGDSDSRDSLIVEHTSRGLVDALARSEQEGSPHEAEEPFSADSSRRVLDRAEVIEALRATTPELAQALAECPSRATDAATVGAAVAAALQASESEASDRVIWAGHLWGLGLNLDSMDSATVRRVNEAMGPAGGRRVEMPDGWCWQDSLAERLAVRAGDNAWTEHAFLELMEGGWQSRCKLCGWDPRIGPDLFRPVIERGDAFLREHGSSTITRSVRWLVAEAHETAWSLSKADPADEYIETSRYALEAPEHRTRAIRLYESLLPEEPPGPRRTAVLNRLARLRLDVDTGFHDFWCVWD